MKRLMLAFCLLAPKAQAAVLLNDTFSRPNGLITNEYATYGGAGGKLSPIWIQNSGSLFAINGSGWTGKPDRIGPNAGSTNGTNSAVFRLNTRRADFSNVAVSMRLFNQGLLSTGAQSFDGVHIWLRYVSEESLYALTINRRDNIVIIKKKVPGGPSNGGTYYTLGQARYAVPYRTWQRVEASALNNADGSVSLKIAINGVQRLAVVDRGTGGAPLRQGAKVGVRGDNCDFLFDDFTVSSIGTAATAPIASSVRAANVTTTAATILWTTDKVSHSQVEYGSTSAYGAHSPMSSATGLYHSMRLANLKPGTVYHYRVKSKDDATGLTGVSRDFTFTTQSTAMTFASVQAQEITSSSARIVWQTNKVSHSQVKYGPTTAYGMTTPNSTATGLWHGVLLTGLRPGTLYHYRAISDGAQSQDFTFTTKAQATAMTFTNVQAIRITATSAYLTWQTDKVSNSQAEYGLSTAYGMKTGVSTATGLYHGVQLSNLQPGRTYHYRVISNGAVSGGFTFRTPSTTTATAK